MTFLLVSLVSQLCTKSNNWRQMGLILKSICQSSQRLAQVEQISARVAMLLLSDSKEKLLLPFAAFAETGKETRGSGSCLILHHNTILYAW